MQITNQILQIQLAPLPSGANVFLSEEQGTGRSFVQAVVDSEEDLFSLFQQFLGLSDIDQTCKFIYMSPNQEQFGFTSEFAVITEASPKRELLVICQGVKDLPSVKRLQANMPVPWFMSAHQFFFSNTEEDIETLRARFKKVFDYTMKTQDVFDRELTSSQIVSRTSHEKRASLILERMIPEYQKIYTIYDQVIALSPPDTKMLVDSYFRHIVDRFSEKESRSLSYSRVSMLQEGEEPSENNETSIEDMIPSIEDLDELFASQPAFEAEVERLVEENIFHRLYEAQEERRLILQQRLSHQLSSKAQESSPAFKDLLYCAIAGSTGRDIYTHNKEIKSAVPDK